MKCLRHHRNPRIFSVADVYKQLFNYVFVLLLCDYIHLTSCLTVFVASHLAYICLCLSLLKKVIHFSFQEPKKQRKKLVTWSVEEVCSWLISLDLELYCESFRQNAIDGLELSNMTGEVLASDLGIGEEHVNSRSSSC